MHKCKKAFPDWGEYWSKTSFLIWNIENWQLLPNTLPLPCLCPCSSGFCTYIWMTKYVSARNLSPRFGPWTCRSIVRYIHTSLACQPQTIPEFPLRSFVPHSQPVAHSSAIENSTTHVQHFVHTESRTGINFYGSCPWRNLGTRIAWAGNTDPFDS